MNTEHHKLTAIKNSTLHDFQLRLRMPGWKPDEVAENPNSDPEQLFVEEVILGSTAGRAKERTPFQPEFDDSNGTKWILGTWLRQTGADGNLLPVDQWNNFNKWLHNLSISARNYNASLYRLRSLHLIAEGNTKTMTPLPDHVVVTPAQAEADWKRDVETIRRLVTPLSSRIVDMVQVNGYIVSIRAVAEIIPETVAPEGHLEILSPQPAGSSSSHWSLSSPFSSYSPFAI